MLDSSFRGPQEKYGLGQPTTKTHVNWVADVSYARNAGARGKNCQMEPAQEILLHTQLRGTYKSSPLTFANGVVRFMLPVECKATALS